MAQSRRNRTSLWPQAAGFESFSGAWISLWGERGGNKETIKIGNEVGPKDGYYALRESDKRIFLIAKHNLQVLFQTVEQPQEGDIVLFTVRPERRPLEPGMLPSATEAEIFESLEQQAEKGGEGSVL